MIRATLDGLERFWLRIDDAATLMLVRTAWALITIAWALSLLPDFSTIFGERGLNPDPYFGGRRYLTLYRWTDEPVLVALGLGALIAMALLVVFGRHLRFAMPTAAFLQISLSDLADPWSIGAEDVLRATGVLLALFSSVTPGELQGRWPKGVNGAGLAPMWPLYLIRIQLVLIYFSTVFEKLHWTMWRDGSAVFHALAIEHYQRFEAPSFMTDSEPVVKVLSWGTLAFEFGLPLLLLWPRTRRVGVVLILVLHFGFDLFIELGFFGPAMFAAGLSFLPARDANRVLGLPRHGLRRVSAWREPRRDNHRLARSE